MKTRKRVPWQLLNHAAAAAMVLLLAGCEQDIQGGGSFYENVFEAYENCNASEIRFLKGKHGIQTAFDECGSNNFLNFTWAPDGIHLYFQVQSGGHVLNGEDKTITTVPTPRPTSDGVWLDAERLAFILPPESEEVGAQVAVYNIRSSSLQKNAVTLQEPDELHLAEESGWIYLTAADETGARHPYRLDLSKGEVERAFPWLEDPVLNFTFDARAGRLTWSDGSSAFLASADGSARTEFPDATRAVLHPDGRYLSLERLGAPVSNFDQTAWDDLTDEARERMIRRRDAWAERLPDWADTEQRPPSLDLFDLERNARYRFTEFQGDLFEWYRPANYYLSFRLWGIEEKELNKNVALMDLADRMRLLERGTYPKGIELVKEGAALAEPAPAAEEASAAQPAATEEPAAQGAVEQEPAQQGQAKETDPGIPVKVKPQ